MLGIGDGLAGVAAGLLVLAAASAPAQAPEIDAEADRILHEMSDHLAGLPTFSITSDAFTDIILSNGQKIQLSASGTGLFDRERGFRFRRDGALGDMEVVFDGESLTVHDAGQKIYHTLPVEGGNDAALDEIRYAFGVEAAGGVDLLYANPYEGLNFEVESGRYLGEVTVAGQRAHHLAYRAADVDWQLWIRAEGEPLPLKYVITSKWVTGAPQFTAQVREWDTEAQVSDAELTFTAPEGAREVDATEFADLGIELSE